MTSGPLPTVVYIAGYGRSGSTVLDIMLGGHARITSAGELTYLFDDFGDPRRFCGCGAGYSDCPLWGELPSSVHTADAAQITRAMDKRRWLFGAGGTGHPSKQRRMSESYGWLWRQVFQHAGGVQGSDYVVDSSKTAREAAYRPVALAMHAGLAVKVIHLLRSPVAIARSLHRLQNWETEGHSRPVPPLAGFRAPLGWTAAQVNAIHLRAILGVDNYLALWYENLQRDPRRELTRIGEFIGCDLSNIISRALAGEAFRVGHNVGGNPLRLAKDVVFKTKAAATS